MPPTPYPKLDEKSRLCHRCGQEIPQFELSAKQRDRIMELMNQSRQMMAIAELRSAVGCSVDLAKLWVVHRGRPKPVYPGPPCPFCGGLLRTSLAKQCPHCYKSWHRQAGI